MNFTLDRRYVIFLAAVGLERVALRESVRSMRWQHTLQLSVRASILSNHADAQGKTKPTVGIESNSVDGKVRCECIKAQAHC